ncbi:MAG: OmpH family outer membrane protein [Prevotella sp.]|nr:OmpH family outer membrane protein [Bacteroides sp.]MCM1366938.1 OmpH family outer membrane protein [Prevotella sp.]MCM1437178.1 OmpH family outer membrane protein [Prevotella sp.]
MLKKILIAVAMALPMFASAQTVKLGLVDISEIVAAMPETKAAQTKIEEASKRYEAEYQKLGEEFQRKYEEFSNMKEDELPAIKDRKTREMSEFQQKVQQFEQQAQQSLAKMQQDEMQPIINKVRSAIEAVGKDGGYSMIYMYDPQLVLFYQNPVENITPQVKARLGL